MNSPRRLLSPRLPKRFLAHVVRDWRTRPSHATPNPGRVRLRRIQIPPHDPHQPETEQSKAHDIGTANLSGNTSSVRRKPQGLIRVRRSLTLPVLRSHHQRLS
jgi:hypothetical protein